MIPELLWEFNPNLTREDKQRLGVIAQDTRNKCQAIIENARATMPPDMFAQYLTDILPVMALL